MIDRVKKENRGFASRILNDISVEFIKRYRDAQAIRDASDRKALFDRLELSEARVRRMEYKLEVLDQAAKELLALIEKLMKLAGVDSTSEDCVTQLIEKIDNAFSVPDSGWVDGLAIPHHFNNDDGGVRLGETDVIGAVDKQREIEGR